MNYDTVVSTPNEENLNIGPIVLTFRDNTMIHCVELPFGVLFLYHYLNIETIHIISSDSGEDDIDWEEYIVEMSNSKTLFNISCAVYNEWENTIDLPLFDETD